MVVGGYGAEELAPRNAEPCADDDFTLIGLAGWLARRVSDRGSTTIQTASKLAG